MKALPVFFASLLLSCATAGAAQMPVPTPAPPPALQPAPTPPPPSITGSAWLLMDYATGQVLAGDNIDARVEPASITKVMTSYVAAAELKAGKIHADDPRSEEHTSELQSLMRISYAVFCLKKKTEKIRNKITTTQIKPKVQQNNTHQPTH